MNDIARLAVGLATMGVFGAAMGWLVWRLRPKMRAAMPGGGARYLVYCVVTYAGLFLGLAIGLRAGDAIASALGSKSMLAAALIAAGIWILGIAFAFFCTPYGRLARDVAAVREKRT